MSRAKMRASVTTAMALALAALVAAGVVEAAQRTFVSTAGNDGNACSLAAPCRGFAKAITVTDANGEIVVLDSGGYGSVTIGKSVTISSPAGVYAGVSVFGGQDGIVVGPGSGKVVLRGLTINGQGGNYGIRVQAGEVHAENVVVSGMGNAGVLVEGGSAVRLSGVTIRLNVQGLQIAPQTGAMAVTVRESEISGNAANGVTLGTALSGIPVQLTMERTTVTRNNVGFYVNSMPTSPAVLVLTQSVVSENAGAGVQVTTGGTVYVRDTAVTRNATGLQQQSTGVLNACGSNLLVANGVAQSGTINVNAAACLDQVAGGTVTNVATGAGLTGGPITTTGTIAMAPSYQLPQACAGGQVAQWSGSAWTCAAAGGTGTVTNVGTGTGLTGGPITTTGTIGLATTQLLPTTACAANQVPQWSGSAWVCAAAGGTGTVTSVGTGTGLTGGPITAAGTISADTAYLQRRVSGTCAAGSSIRTINADGTVACQTDTTGPANAFVQGGNAFGAEAVIGTTDNNALEISVNNARVMRYEPNATSPNILGGRPNNSVGAYAGQAVLSGGKVGNDCPDPVPGGGAFARSCANQANGNYAVIGGGYSNSAGSWGAFVGGGTGNSVTGSGYSSVVGGAGNTASGSYAAVVGGVWNIASGFKSVVGGGERNTANGTLSTVAGGAANFASGGGATIGGGGTDGAVLWPNVSSGTASTIAGGMANDATGDFSTVGGGNDNDATGSSSTVGGGATNRASGLTSTVPGGWYNSAAGDHSFAAGRRAKAQAFGTFAWADGNDFDFVAGTPQEFAVRATGGVRFVTAIDGAGAPTATVSIAPNGAVAVPATLQVDGVNAWDLDATEGDFRVGDGTYRLKIGVPVGGGGAGDVALKVEGGLARLNITAAGGTRVFSNAARGTGVSLAAGSGSWSSVSDRALKANVRPVDAGQVLAGVVAMPLNTWNYVTQDASVVHMGPMAQDFRSAFGLGENETTIATVDAQGVALAAIQGLNAKLEATVAEQAREIEAQRSELADLRGRVALVESLRGELAALRSLVAGLARGAPVLAAAR